MRGLGDPMCERPNVVSEQREQAEQRQAAHVRGLAAQRLLQRLHGLCAELGALSRQHGAEVALNLKLVPVHRV